jgi:hypothetical protein
MAFEGKKVAQIKAEDVMNDARANKRVKWLKNKAEEIGKAEQSSMKAFFQLRKAYLAEFYPELLERKKAPKKTKSLFEKIAEMEE